MSKRVLINGTFDIVHSGHIAMINFAREIGDSVVIAIDTDRRVKELKGEARPINNQDERKLLLEQFRWVGKVRLFDSDEELINIIKEEKIWAMVKGSDYVGKPIVGREHIKHMVWFDRIDEYSTTKKIQDIINRG
jgi:D-beta-D-heptose 7-phosphate kinase/D-beta-D-heptose 1-phosphate adenosyltransferase